MRIIHFCVNLFIELGALVMTVVVVVVLLFNVPVNISGHVETAVNITTLFMGRLRPK